jgi:hypothetical protein
MPKALIISILMLFQQAPATFTGIEHIPGTDSLKVSVRLDHELFIRDYQQTIFDDLDLEVLRKMKPFPSDLANNYLNSRISIRSNKEQVIGKLLRMEENGGDIRFIMLFRVDRKVKSITVKNSILNGFSSRVENFVVFKSGNFETTAKLTPEHQTEVFLINK